MLSSMVHLFVTWALKNGVIAALGAGLTAAAETEVIDCESAVVTPDGIDDHVHLAQDSLPRAREAGYVCAENIETGTRSVVVGGTTTVLLFAEQCPGESLREKVESYHHLAREQGSYADYGFHVIITDPSEGVLEEELPLLAREGIMSMKLFLTYKHMGISDKQFLRLLYKTRDMLRLTNTRPSCIKGWGSMFEIYQQQEA